MMTREQVRYNKCFPVPPAFYRLIAVKIMPKTQSTLHPFKVSYPTTEQMGNNNYTHIIFINFRSNLAAAMPPPPMLCKE